MREPSTLCSMRATCYLRIQRAAMLLVMTMANSVLGLSLRFSHLNGHMMTPSGTQLRMMDEHMYQPYFTNEGNMNRGWQQSEQVHSYNHLDRELEMMEQKLLQFQESSSRRSQELLDSLKVYPRQEAFRRGENRPATAFMGDFVEEIGSELLFVSCDVSSQLTH